MLPEGVDVHATATIFPDSSGDPRLVPQAAPDPLTRWDALGIAASTVLFLVVSYLRSRNTIFWGDEIMGWLVLHQPNLHAFLRAWWGGVDSSGIFFYLFAAPWLHLFADREIALRLFSAAGIAAACALLWITARRFVSTVVAAAVIPLTFFANPTLLWQLGNGRSYGVLLAAAALAGYAFLQAAPHRRPTASLLLLTFSAHLLLVGSHILGPLYSGVFLAGLIAQDLFFRVRRPTLYLSAIASWALLAFSWRNLKATSDLGKPSFWTLKPHLRDLLLGFFDYADSTRHLTYLLLAGVLAATLARRKLGVRDRLVPPDRLPFYFLVGTLFAANVLVFAVSRVATSIFVDRYLLPLTLADALLLCELVHRCLALLPTTPLLRRAAFTVVMLVLLAKGRETAQTRLGYPQIPYTAELVAALPAGQPVICTSIGTFVELIFYQGSRVPLYTPIDWPIQLQLAQHGGGVSGAHEMDNWKSGGFYADHILPTADLLARFPDFVVVADPGDRLWIDRRVVPNPRYTATFLATLPSGVHFVDVWQVHTR